MPAATAAARTSCGVIDARPSVTLSASEREKRNASCGTHDSAERSRRRDSVVTSCPPTNTVPAGGSQRRASSRPSVDLPLPVGPTTATISPGRTSKRHVAQHRLAPLIREGEPGEADRRRQRGLPAVLIVDRGRARLDEHLLDAFHRGQAATHDRQRQAERDRRPRQVREVPGERHQRAQRQPAARDRRARPTQMMTSVPTPPISPISGTKCACVLARATAASRREALAAANSAVARASIV